MTYFIDRIVDGKAFAEDENGEKTQIDICIISGKIREGCVVLFENGEYFVSEEKTADRKKNLFSLQNKLFKKKNG